jgi:fumarate hydratase class II
MANIEDTEIQNGHYEPGALLENGKWGVEFYSMGQVKVPAHHLWGSQTQRSLIHFSIGDDHMPIAAYYAYGCVKKSAAINERLGKLLKEVASES